MPHLIDTHAHVNFHAFKDDGDETLKRALDKDIWVINVGSQYSTSRRAVEYAEKYEEGIYAVIGLHPIHLYQIEVDSSEIPYKTKPEEWDVDKYRELAKNSKVVAIGETGLDYYRLPKDSPGRVKEKQREVFKQELKLAKELELPVILHCRGTQDDPYGAYDEMLKILLVTGYPLPVTPSGVIHCYGGNLEQAKKFLGLGFLISFTGIITFEKKAEELQKIVKEMPLEKIMLETDCPYLAPEPYRGKRNEPAYVEYVARKIAELKGISYDEVAEVTTKNAMELFNLKE